jgi:hypothetical protein
MTDTTLTAEPVADPPAPTPEPVAPLRAWRLPDVTRAVTFAVFALVFASAVVGNWLRAQNVDPQYMYDLIQRTIKYGGSYYASGIHDKGPLEPIVFHAAAWITSPDGFWYGISLFIAIAGLILGAAGARTARSAGANRDLAVAVAAVMFIHFVMSRADYAGVLYARNMTTALLAITWIIALSAAPWTTKRRATFAVIASGCALGLAVQTLLPTVFAGFAVAIMVFGEIRDRRPADETRHFDRVFVASGFLTFISAPVWYFLRGHWNEFWSGWWIYSRNFSAATGRSLGGQFALGWDQFYAYYEKRPLATLVVLAFVAVAFLDWAGADRRTRRIYVTLIGWFVGGWIELILSQRYTTQYFVVTSLPTALMVAALAGRAYRSIVAARGPFRATYAWPLVALVVAIYLSGTQPFVSDMHDLSQFTSVHKHAQEIDQGQSGTERSVRAVLDLVSKDGDPLLVWTNDPWPYMSYHRVSATRFIWESFLTGQVYLGRQSLAYVLPHSWDWFRSDLEQSKPLGFVHVGGGTIPPGSPFDTYVRDNFTVAYPDPNTPVSLRNDVVNQILNPITTDVWAVPSGSSPSGGWRVDGNDVTFTDAGNRDNDRLAISNDSCFSLTGTVDSDGPPGGIRFHFDDNSAKSEPVKLDFDGDTVSSSSDTVEFAHLPSGTTATGPVPFTLVVGRRSAALVVGGQVRAAVRLPASTHVSVTSERSHLQLRDLRVGPAPEGSGCTG